MCPAIPSGSGRRRCSYSSRPDSSKSHHHARLGGAWLGAFGRSGGFELAGPGAFDEAGEGFGGDAQNGAVHGLGVTYGDDALCSGKVGGDLDTVAAVRAV